MHLEVARMEIYLALEMKRGLQVIEERDRALSQLSTQEYRLVAMLPGLAEITSPMVELCSQ